jgi:uncharacterized membrane protein YqjE
MAEARVGGMRSGDLLRAVQLVRVGGMLVLDHAVLLVQLAQLEWAEERERLKKLIASAVVGAVLLGVGLLHVSALAVFLTWGTPYCLYVAVGLTLLYLVALFCLWRHVVGLVHQGGDPFAGSRNELAATVELLRSRL